ncbi:MAG TPA: hypothetical protein VJP02_19175 [Candidatus Sulfotelmatobacter sp.]|nr:hypothetical protein [Candidatus Sulfotelmatobacter sp.]
MPETVTLSVTCGDGVGSRLFNDGKDQLFLSISSLDSLAPPAKSGIFNIYGICHELGHLAMYRTLKNRDWLANSAAEGWAHFIGSAVVDRVYAAKGESLWPEPYDYRQDGVARLQKDVASKEPSEMTRAAAQWQRLSDIIGLGSVAQVFTGWELAGIDAVRPSDSLLAVVEKIKPSGEAALGRWWRDAEPVLVERLVVSEVRAERCSLSSLSGQTIRIPSSKPTETSRASIAGGGEGRRFTVPDASDWYLTAVWVYGSRYGDEKPPENTFDIALSDVDAKLISIWKGRYAAFSHLQDDWTRFEVSPTRLPSTFFVTLNFRADASHGVYVAYDSSTKGSSIDSLPGKPPQNFDGGDWMIQLELDRKK